MELVFWLLIGVLFVTALVKAATPKGVVGERRVQRLTDRGLNQDVYRSLHDLILPTPDGSTQIDHVIVSQFGVFVIETKNLAGWIFGDERSRQWTQTLYRKKYRFQNPLRQNYKHVKAVEKIAGLRSRCVHSVVVFVGDSGFKTPMPPNVVYRRGLVPYVRSMTDVLLTENEVERAAHALESAQLSDKGAKRRHIRTVKENRLKPNCPRCGKTMLLRTAKQGRSAGGRFWGCSGYPKCRATKPVA